MIIDNKEFSTVLGKVLQEHRLRKNFTLDQVIQGAHLSISRSSLSAIENGSQDISARDLFVLGKLLGFSSNEVLDEALRALTLQKFQIDLNR